MADLKTNEALLRALSAASARKPTAVELRKQRVSYVMGTLKDYTSATRERVERVLAEQEGR